MQRDKGSENCCYPVLFLALFSMVYWTNNWRANSQY